MSLFGGTEKIELKTPAQQRLLRSMADLLQGQIGQPGPVFQGEVAPGLSEFQMRGLDMLGGLSPDSIPGVDSAIADMVAGRSAQPFDADQYYQQSVYAPAKLAFDDEMRAIEARYGNKGMSGGFGDAVGQGAARFGVGIGSQLADLAREERFLADNRRSAGVGAAFNRNRDIASMASSLLGGGGLQRGVQSEQNLANLNRWNAGQAYNNPWLGFYGPTVGTQSYGIGQQQGLLPGIASMAGSLLGGAGLFMGGMK